jgi:hypothetical protein
MPHQLKILSTQLTMSKLFYNVPKNDPLMQSLDSFVHISEPVKDAAGVAVSRPSPSITHKETLADPYSGAPAQATLSAEQP